ncbi:MAG: M48 family metalloprotease [Bacteroidota bacterium]|nr:M48 family metalloprotease [Bacteroidota bacterium]
MKYFIYLLPLFFISETSAQKLRTTQPTNYLREGPAAYFQITGMLTASVAVDKLDQKGSWLKVKTEQDDQGWLSENSFVRRAGGSTRDTEMMKGKTTTRASCAELAAAVKGFGKKYVDGSGDGTEDISKYSEPEVTSDEMEKFEHSFTIEPFRGYMSIEKPFDIQFHEEGIGLGIAQKIVRQKGLVNDPTATRYINSIGNHISKYTKAYDLGFRFYILNDPRASAFAVPGGYIFITKGMFQICSNEAELASVIAHEMVHVIQRHGIKELKLSEAKIKSEQAFAELEDETGPMSADEKDLEEYADHAYQNLIAPRLLEYEVEADELGMVYVKRAGYDPTAFVKVLEQLQEAPTEHPDIFDDNYMKKNEFSERLLKANQVVRSEGYRSNSDKQFAERYQRNTSGVR